MTSSERDVGNVLDLSGREHSPTVWSERSPGDKDCSSISPRSNDQTHRNIYIESRATRSPNSPQLSPSSFAYSEDQSSPHSHALHPSSNRERSASGVVRQLSYSDRMDHSQLSEKFRLMMLAKEYLMEAVATEQEQKTKGDGGSDIARILTMAALDNYKQRIREFEEYKALLEVLSTKRAADRSPLNIPAASSGLKSSTVDMPDLVLASPTRARDQPAENTNCSSDSSVDDVYRQRPNQVCGKRRYEDVEQWARNQALRHSDERNASAIGKAYGNETYSKNMDQDRGGMRMPPLPPPPLDQSWSRVGGGRVSTGPSATVGSGAGDLVNEELRQVMERRCARMTASAVDSYISNGTSRDTMITGRMSSLSTEKDEAYYERRRKNNEAAKRSRDFRRNKEGQVAQRVVFLEDQNLQLRAQIAALKAESANLQRFFCERHVRDSTLNLGSAPTPAPGTGPGSSRADGRMQP